MDKRKERVLDVVDLSVHFPLGKRGRILKAVDHVSLHIDKGETLGLVGESGCGKTTTGRSIIRLVRPTSGEIRFNGESISGRINREQAKRLSKEMAMVFQDPVASLNPRMTIEEIIGEGLKVQGIKNRKERLALINEMVEKVGLTREHVTRYPHEFSGGQRQRIGIARALINRPYLIIADEPVSALDVSVQAQVLNLLAKLRDEFELTTLFIAHDLAVVKYVSDRIGVMYMGKLVELGKARDIYANPVHPYTRALLSAIPQPDPLIERKRRRTAYDPQMHDYSEDKPSYHDFGEGHTAYINEAEYREALRL